MDISIKILSSRSEVGLVDSYRNLTFLLVMWSRTGDVYLDDILSEGLVEEIAAAVKPKLSVV